MIAAKILSFLQGEGVRLILIGERLRAEPRGRLTDVLRVAIRTNKAALIEQLSADSAATASSEATAAETTPPLTQSDEAMILRWLEAIGERDGVLIQMVMDQCRSDPKARTG